MNKYRRTAIIIIIAEILGVILCNVWYIGSGKDISGRSYRVEAKRVAQQLQKTPLDCLDLTQYETIKDVSIFHPEEICNQDYVVEVVNGDLYRIIYAVDKRDTALWEMNICMVGMILITIGVFQYIWKRILSPFHKMSELTYELAKGNLSVPLKEGKSKLFGKFVWGMDMLRENLENGKQKELELQKEKKTLILSLSHDIKTPLSAIDMYTKALQKNLYDTEEKKEQVLDGILHNIQEIKGYVDKIVTASREDFLNLSVQNDKFYLIQMIDAIDSYYRNKLSICHTEFHIEKFSNCLLFGDMDHMIEVIQNVMENAIKYGDGKRITIGVSEEENYKLIEVCNTGSSLKAEEISNIFDSFYRGSNSTNIKGSGLGLYIARTLMKKMDGDIYADIKDNKFYVTIVIKKA